MSSRPMPAQSYYGRPILKPHPWKPAIAAYFFTGGLAGASAMLAAGARLTGNDRLARSAGLVSAAGYACSPPLLIYDLGRPERFLNMLRVFKPTSPMSVGSWTLAAASGAQFTAAACELSGRLPRLGRVAEAAGGTLGGVIATYTGVLIADTAVPVWHEARAELPGLFAAGAAASAGGATLLATSPESAGPARRLAIAGCLGELVVSRLMERRLGALAEPYRRGRPGALDRASRALTAAGLAGLMAGGRRRPGLARLGGALTLAGAACKRLAVLEAGALSATDPAYVVAEQRPAADPGTA
jgi:formate-dependent nitrite reductase membrane component NrfD